MVLGKEFSDALYLFGSGIALTLSSCLYHVHIARGEKRLFKTMGQQNSKGEKSRNW